MVIKAVIFDLDGTLLNTIEDLADSTNYALSSFGYPKRSLEEINSFVGNGVRILIERAVGNNNSNFEQCLKLFKEHYKDNMMNKTKPYQGIYNMLNVLKSKGIKTSVVSNKFDAAVKELTKKYFFNLIDVSIGEAEDEGINKKPAPDMINKALKELNVDKNSAIYVGDSDTDILTAKNSNLPCISVGWGFRSKEFLIEHGAKNIISSPSELLNFI